MIFIQLHNITSITHKDSKGELTGCPPYTMATIHSMSGGSFDIFLPYGHRLELKPPIVDEEHG